ncbi:hypothetical protein [Chitinilyticum piscinae]|uniref:Uncharacterized protein n=1 Tax=Chitinilyticum piscinae TaxID=2866724 RepID=A0A8J7FS35_9NEIS|nr:hypothetical protein [Chitinilyticum piscinae]MBE9610994.1 hypothetical protein [Chitinilyticum piscinae]
MIDTHVQLPGNLVLIKTDKGQQEIATRAHQLPQALRRLLILVDGAKSVSALTVLLVGLEVIPLLRELAHQGFVEPAPGQSGRHTTALDAAIISTPAELTVLTPAPQVPAPPEAGPLSEHRIRMIRTLMLESCELYLGLFGRTLQPEIASIRDEAGLRRVLARWHLAMRESALSDAQALALVDEIRKLMRA